MGKGVVGDGWRDEFEKKACGVQRSRDGQAGLGGQEIQEKGRTKHDGIIVAAQAAIYTSKQMLTSYHPGFHPLGQLAERSLSSEPFHDITKTTTDNKIFSTCIRRGDQIWEMGRVYARAGYSASHSA